MIEINLHNLKANINYYASSQKKLIGVVKNNAYGHGSITIAKALVNFGLDYLFVNELEEALPLVEAGIKVPILIHNSLNTNEYHYLSKYPNLVVTLNSYQDYLSLLADPKLDKVKVHLQIDTKMNRLGIKTYQEYEQLLKMLIAHSKFIIEGIYTHFASLEVMNEQINTFRPFAEAYPYPMVHCAASATAHLCSYGNYARIGLGLYHHQQLMSVKVKPLKIQYLEAGEALGYNGKYVAKEKEIIAVLPLGYGDGYSRRFEGFHVYCNEKYYEIVGRICMNHLFVKVDKYINLDSVFEVLSPKIPASLLAEYINTIPYEIYTMWQYRKVKYLS